jgi:isopentenyldiphosphate isomerase
MRSKGVSSSTEQLFDTLLRDSLTQTFGEVLGRIAGQALLDAMKAQTSLGIEALSRRPDLLDKALTAHLGSAARVLERRILRTLTAKTATGIALNENEVSDFGFVIEKIRKQFLKRKQAGNQPQILE